MAKFYSQSKKYCIIFIRINIVFWIKLFFKLTDMNTQICNIFLIKFSKSTLNLFFNLNPGQV